MIHIKITCDFCGDQIHSEPMSSRGGRGLSMDGDGRWTIDDKKEDSPKHLCNRCLSSIADLNVCIAGFIGCGGGLKCSSDHK